MKRSDVEQVLAPVMGLSVAKLEMPARVVVADNGDMILQSGDVISELSDNARAGLLQRSKVAGGVVNRLSATTASTVMTELLGSIGATSVLYNRGEVQGFANQGRYRMVDTTMVLNSIEDALGSDMEVHRVGIRPNNDVRLEILGDMEYEAVKGDMIRAGTMVQYNPVGLSHPRVQSYGLRLVCTNGATATDVLRSYALTGDNDDLGQWFQKSVRVSYDGLGDTVGRWRELQEDDISATDRPLILGSLAQRARLRGPVRDAFWARATEAPPENAYDMLNLLTWMSSHVITDPQQVARMQDVGAEFVDEQLHNKHCPTCHRPA